MAHEKLSPRQKMIGMMYLVLTAMLALNVQKEVVKAFIKVDKGLKLTVDNYVTKNNLIYADFASSNALHPEKTGPYYKKALYVKQRAEEMYTYIQNLKIEMIKMADGDKAKAINGNEIDIDLVEKYDENSVPSELLIGPKEDGKGYTLMALLNDYRDSLIKVLDRQNPAVEASLQKTLTCEKVKGEDNQLEAWPNGTFQLMPLVGANALLTKIQVDVRNAETEVINWLYTQIDKTDFKVNKLAAMVLPNANTVALGTNYEAKIVLAGIDSLQRPIITVGQTPIELDDAGRGIYSVRATSLGTKPYSGMISLVAPDGTKRDIKFNSEYQVVESSANVSASGVNVLYREIDNPLDVSAPGIRPDRIKVRSNGGNVLKKKVQNPRTKEYFPGEWAIMPTADPGTIIDIIVSGEDENGKTIPYPPKKFKVKNYPTPVAEFGGKSTGKIAKGTTQISEQIFATLKDFDFDLRFQVIGFTLYVPTALGSATLTSNSSKLTSDQKAAITKMVRGQRLTFDGITAKSPSGRIIELQGIILTID